MTDEPNDGKISIYVHDNDASPEVRAYFFALGQFITMFGNIERLVYITSCISARVAFPIGRAAFGGSARASESMDRTKRLLSVWKEIEPNGIVTDDLTKKVTYVFDQFGAINTMRNYILHHGPELGPGAEWTISNWQVVHTEKKVREVTVSAADLINMTHDLQKMLAVLLAINQHLGGDVEVEEFLGEVYQRLLAAPWQHKTRMQPGAEQGTQRGKAKRSPNPSP